MKKVLMILLVMVAFAMIGCNKEEEDYSKWREDKISEFEAYEGNKIYCEDLITESNTTVEVVLAKLENKASIDGYNYIQFIKCNTTYYCLIVCSNTYSKLYKADF